MSPLLHLTHLASAEAALSALRQRLAYSPDVLLVEFAGLVLFTALAFAGRRWAAVLVVPFALAWPLLNQLVEGPTLVALSYDHGITLTDLLSVVAFLAAGYAFLRPRAVATASRTASSPTIDR